MIIYFWAWIFAGGHLWTIIDQSFFFINWPKCFFIAILWKENFAPFFHNYSILWKKLTAVSLFRLKYSIKYNYDPSKKKGKNIFPSCMKNKSLLQKGRETISPCKVCLRNCFIVLCHNILLRQHCFAT